MEAYQVPEGARTQKNANGVAYVYYDYPFWESGKNRGSHRRLYIGQIGSNGEFLPNAYYLGLLQAGTRGKPTIFPTKTEKDDVILQYNIYKYNKNNISNGIEIIDIDKYYGAVYLLEQIGGELTGVAEDLAKCFPDNYKKILSVVYYLTLQDNAPLYRFERWNFDHKHPCDRNLTSQELSALLAEGISEKQKNDFFRLQAARRSENEYLAYDTTSISSTSKLIKSTKFGRNKDDEHLEQINLAMLIGEQSKLPVYYRMLPGNISDVSTITRLIEDMKFLDINKYKFILDRGFYSSNNINLMYRNGYDFILSARRNLSFLKEINTISKNILSDNRNNSQYYNDILDTYGKTFVKQWKYRYLDKLGMVVEEQDREIFIHVYYNMERYLDEKHKFLKLLRETVEALENNEPLHGRQISLAKNYIITKKSIEGKIEDVKINYETVNEKCLDFGYIVLLANKNSSNHDVLKKYRQKDMIEKAFDNLKDRLKVKRTEVHSDLAFNNKLFIAFISLIYISYIDKKMKEHSLYKNFTMDTLFDNLDIIKICIRGNNKPIYSEITNKQRILYEKLGVTPPV